MRQDGIEELLRPVPAVARAKLRLVATLPAPSFHAARTQPYTRARRPPAAVNFADEALMEKAVMRPWHADGDTHISDSEMQTIAHLILPWGDVHDDSACEAREANARLIVMAANHFAEMVALVEDTAGLRAVTDSDGTVTDPNAALRIDARALLTRLEEEAA